MKPTRRDFVASLSALAVVPGCIGPREKDSGEDTAGPQPAPRREPEPAPWEPGGEEDVGGFGHGVQVGDVGPTDAWLSVWSDEPELRFVLVAAQDDGWTEVQAVDAVPTEDGRLQLHLEGLVPDTAHMVVATTPDGTRRSRPSRFRTALDEDGWRIVTVAATSCLGGNHPWPSMSFASAEHPDVQLLLGDTVYADRAFTLDEYRGYWEYALGTQGLRDFSAASSLIATWDDHEVMNNFQGSDAAPTQFERALQVFREAIPQRLGPGGTGLWRSLRWGRTVEFFVLDSRGERDGEENYLSPEQFAWLQAGLLASRARFKLILNSVPITDYGPMIGTALQEDRWQGYPAQRAAVLSFVEDKEIGGVLWLTGDFHMSTVSRVDPAGGIGEKQWEVMVGPGGSFRNLMGEFAQPSEQWPLIFAEWNTTMLTLNPELGTVHIRFIGDDGELIDEKTLEV